MCTCDFYRYEYVYRNLKTFLEEHCAVSLDRCYFYVVEKCWVEHDIDSAYGVYIH